MKNPRMRPRSRMSDAEKVVVEEEDDEEEDIKEKEATIVITKVCIYSSFCVE